MRPPIGVFCSSSSNGGLELNVVRMAEWLKRAGYPITLIGCAHSEIAHRAKELNLSFQSITTEKAKASYISLWQLIQVLKLGQFHTLLIHTSADLRRAILARSLAFNNTRLVYVQHMQLGTSKKDFLHTLFFRRLAGWIVPLPYLAQQVNNLTRFDSRRIFEIPFGIELEPFIENKPCQTSARLKLGLPAQAVIAGCIGRYDRQKNQALLIHAAVPLIQMGYPLHLVFVGEETRHENQNYSNYLQSLAIGTGIESHVHFLPFRKDVNTAYAALDIFVLTSQAETYGMVTIEAMAAGLPVIATRSGGTPEIVRDKHAGLLFEPNNVNDLAATLRLLLDFPELRKRFGRKGRQDAIERFSHLIQVSQLTELIEKLD